MGKEMEAQTHCRKQMRIAASGQENLRDHLFGAPVTDAQSFLPSGYRRVQGAAMKVLQYGGRWLRLRPYKRIQNRRQAGEE